MNALSPYKVIDTQLATEVFKVGQPLFYYLDDEGKRIALKTKENQEFIMVLSDEESLWNPNDFDFYLDWEIKLEIKIKELFNSEDACAAPDTQLGIGLQWFSQSSRQRDSRSIFVFDRNTRCSTYHASLCLPKATLRGDVSFVLVLYVAGVGDDYIDHPQYASEVGTVLGEISETYRIILDGFGSEFTIFTENKPGQPLWRMEYDLEDPSSDIFIDTVRVFFNLAEENAYELFISDNVRNNKYYRKEIFAEILINIIEKVRAVDPNFVCLDAAEEGSVANFIGYHFRNNNIDASSLTDIADISYAVRKFMCKS